MEQQYKRYIINDLPKKMVFLTGPRQVGKTWLETTKLLILDELHKIPGWKNYLKNNNAPVPFTLFLCHHRERMNSTTAEKRTHLGGIS